MENYREQFEKWLVPLWGQTRFDEWWSSPFPTLGGMRTPHKLCLDGYFYELQCDVHSQVKRESDPLQIIRDCQEILARHLPPDGPSAKDTISELLAILDGPRARAALTISSN